MCILMLKQNKSDPTNRITSIITSIKYQVSSIIINSNMRRNNNTRSNDNGGENCLIVTLMTGFVLFCIGILAAAIAAIVFGVLWINHPDPRAHDYGIIILVVGCIVILTAIILLIVWLCCCCAHNCNKK